VHRRKTDDPYEDMDNIRENIINYEDEGGGEVDIHYDLNVLRAIDSKMAPVGLLGRGTIIADINAIYIMDLLKTKRKIFYKKTDEVPNICGFLNGKKESCNKDPDTNPFDDVWHYAYEGKGNSEGDLLSLASC